MFENQSRLHRTMGTMGRWTTRKIHVEDRRRSPSTPISPLHSSLRYGSSSNHYPCHHIIIFYHSGYANLRDRQHLALDPTHTRNTLIAFPQSKARQLNYRRHNMPITTVIFDVDDCLYDVGTVSFVFESPVRRRIGGVSSLQAMVSLPSHAHGKRIRASRRTGTLTG